MEGTTILESEMESEHFLNRKRIQRWKTEETGPGSIGRLGIYENHPSGSIYGIIYNFYTRNVSWCQNSKPDISRSWLPGVLLFWLILSQYNHISGL